MGSNVSPIEVEISSNRQSTPYIVWDNLDLEIEFGPEFSLNGEPHAPRQQHQRPNSPTLILELLVGIFST
jgi:hypothetical protein